MPDPRVRQPYRVLHVIDSLDLGGAQIVLRNLLKYGNRERFTFEVACMHGTGVFWQAIAEEGWPLHSLSFSHKFPMYVPKLAALCVRRRFHVAHFHLLASNVIGKPVAAACRVPVRINHDHCNDKLTDPRPWALPADRFTNRWTTHAIAVSESTRRFLVDHEGLSPDQATTIHNGIDIVEHQPRPERREEARARLGLPQQAKIVGGIGRLAHQKNFTLFLNVAARLIAGQPDVHFAIAGTGEEEAMLKAHAAQLGLQDRVHFLGMISDTTWLYPALDTLLLTSRYEGLPMTILESMASGVPIVAPALDGIAEVLTDGTSASLFEPGNLDSALECLKRVSEDPAVAARIAAAALLLVREKHSAQAVAAAVENLYLRYLEPRE